MVDFIKVPFQDKEKVKELGARWDKEMKSWYIPEDADKEKFKQWEVHDPLSSLSDPNATRIYLTVPFAEKDAAKSLGARWDSDKKQWYFLSDRDSAPFAKWIASGSSSSPTKSSGQSKKPSQKDDLADELDDILSLGDE